MKQKWLRWLQTAWLLCRLRRWPGVLLTLLLCLGAPLAGWFVQGEIQHLQAQDQGLQQQIRRLDAQAQQRRAERLRRQVSLETRHNRLLGLLDDPALGASQLRFNGDQTAEASLSTGYVPIHQVLLAMKALPCLHINHVALSRDNSVAPALKASVSLDLGGETCVAP